MLETFRDVNEIGAAIRAVRSVCDLPIVAQMTTEEDGNSLDGVAPEAFVPELERAAPTSSASTAASGRRRCSRRSSGWRAWRTSSSSAQPNAGKPREIEGRNLYLCSPEYMASYARRFINSGVRLVGGCCGTTPDHIRAIKIAVRSLAPRRGDAGRRRRGAPAPRLPPPVAAGRRASRSRAWPTRWRAAGSSSASSWCRRAAIAPTRWSSRRGSCKIRGVDLVNIPDNPRASARMSALSAAVLVQQQAGVETILHYACRDRNLLGMQSDLLGAHAMGVRNLLLVTGDPPQVGDYPGRDGGRSTSIRSAWPTSSRG